MDFWTDLFNVLESKDSYLAIFWLVGAAVLGWLIGLISRWIGVSRWKKRYNAKESELKKLRAEYNGFKEKYDLQEADLQKANLSIEEYSAALRIKEQDMLQVQNDLSVYESQYNTLKESFQTTQSENQTYLIKIEDLQTQLAEAKAENDRLNAEIKANDSVLGDMASFQSNFNATKNQLNTLENRITQLEDENAGLKDEVQALSVDKTPVTLMDENSGISQSTGTADALTLSMIEEKLSALEDENITLHKELDELKASGSMAVVDRSIPTEDIPEAFNEEDDEVTEKDEAILAAVSPEEQSARAVSTLNAAIGTKIPAATEADKDDLKKINGIGPFIEQKLNSLGIYTYDQISQLDGDLINTLTDAIQFFPGRIERDDWVGQATALKGASETASAIKMYDATTASSSSSKMAKTAPDNLKIVEGIGPKIEQILKENGINSWEDLSGTEVSRLREILEAAGSRFRMHSPTTWPDQAKLASLGQWDKLEEFQSYLTGGRDPKS